MAINFLKPFNIKIYIIYQLNSIIKYGKYCDSITLHSNRGSKIEILYVCYDQ
jgi:hypothetical protein